MLGVGKYYIMANLIQRIGCSMVCVMEVIGMIYYMFSSDSTPKREHAKLGSEKSMEEEHLNKIEKKMDTLVTRFARELKSTNIRLEKIRSRYEAIAQ